MHEKVYARMLRLYPRDWRREFGVEMALVFADALHAARRRGALAVARLWWREVVTLPANVMSTISKNDGCRPNPILAAAILVIISSVASHVVANAGLFHATSLVMLAAGLAASGFIFGAGRRIGALLLVVLTIGASLAADAIAMRFASSGVTSTLTIPGVRLDVSRVESLPAYGTLIERAKAAGSPRIRTTTFARDGSLYLTVVRSGGVDGAYALLTMLVLAGTAWSGRRLSRGPQLVTD
jgi:hypothetical protein